MNRKILLALCSSLWLFAVAHADDDDDASAKVQADGAMPALSAAQRQAVGINLVHPVPMSLAQAMPAYGEVLDPSALVIASGRVDSSRMAAHAATAEVDRLNGLYRNDFGVSLKLLQTAQAQQIELQTQAQAAASLFALQWGPLAKLGAVQRQALIERLDSGQCLLLRADLPGQHSFGKLPQSALLDVDGIGVPARVLGSLAQTNVELRSVGLLLQVDHAPDGLVAGARVAVALQGTAQKGLLIPNSALLYGEQGAYVYRQQSSSSADQKFQYTMVRVSLLQAQGDHWLVAGLDDDDQIVAQGAGVLWSLQGLGSVVADDDDD